MSLIEFNRLASGARVIIQSKPFWDTACNTVLKYFC